MLYRWVSYLPKIYIRKVPLFYNWQRNCQMSLWYPHLCLALNIIYQVHIFGTVKFVVEWTSNWWYKQQQYETNKNMLNWHKYMTFWITESFSFLFVWQLAGLDLALNAVSPDPVNQWHRSYEIMINSHRFVIQHSFSLTFKMFSATVQTDY